MRARDRLLLSLLLLSGLPAESWPADAGLQRVNFAAIYQQPVRRLYRDTSRYLVSGNGIVLEGTPAQILRLSGWLDDIRTVPHGQATLDAILGSGNRLTIRHSTWALLSSGRTLAPSTGDLINGRGEDVLILFDTRIPEQGSHWVFDARGERLAFTAVQNLFHELVHARHQLNGTWRYWDSEGQAIEEENIFRAQHGARQGQADAPLRAGVEGQQFWWPEPGQEPRTF
jgi:hypothetical protein